MTEIKSTHKISIRECAVGVCNLCFDDIPILHFYKDGEILLWKCPKEEQDKLPGISFSKTGHIKIFNYDDDPVR